MDNRFEKEALSNGYRHIAGVDEAGRGPLAGPVVSAAVILPDPFTLEGLDDSKKLTETQRNRFFEVIQQKAVAVAVGMSDPGEIDRINILRAALLSMKRAVLSLKIPPDFLLIDGKFTLDINMDQRAVIKGDAVSISIAAASVIAKVTRDRLMKKLNDKYPGYGFDRHKGYPTPAHKKAVLALGPCPVHRRTFKGVREMLDDG